MGKKVGASGPQPSPSELTLEQKIAHTQKQLTEVKKQLASEVNSDQKQKLAAKIKQLEEQLTQAQAENDNLKALVKSERARADNYQQQLKVIVESLYQ